MPPLVLQKEAKTVADSVSLEIQALMSEALIGAELRINANFELASTSTSFAFWGFVAMKKKKIMRLCPGRVAE